MHLAWMYLQFLGLHSRPPQSLMYMCCDVMCFASLEPCQDYVTIQEWHLSTLTVPTSGLLECISKGVNGLGMGILAWGDEVVRIPRTRIRSPRHFGMFAADPTGGQIYCCKACWPA